MSDLKDTAAWHFGEAAVVALRNELLARGHSVSRLDLIAEGGAPCTHGPQGKMPLLDLLTGHPLLGPMLCEVKYKDHTDRFQKGKVFSPSANNDRPWQWQQGMDLHEWEYFPVVANNYNLPAWLYMIVLKPGREAEVDSHIIWQSIKELAKYAQIVRKPHTTFRRGAVYFPMNAWRCRPLTDFKPPNLPSLAINLNPWERISKRTGYAPAWKIEYCDLSPFERDIHTIIPKKPAKDISDHYCPECGEYGAFGYGPPKWSTPRRWFCAEHRGIAEME